MGNKKKENTHTETNLKYGKYKSMLWWQFNYVQSINHENIILKSTRSTLSKEVTLHITIIIFTCPYKSTTAFQHISYHIINKSMFIPNREGITINLNSMQYETKMPKVINTRTDVIPTILTALRTSLSTFAHKPPEKYPWTYINATHKL